MQTSFGLRQPGWIAEFRAFIARGNVVDLAIGIIIGAFRRRSSRVIRILHRGGRGPRGAMRRGLEARMAPDELEGLEYHGVGGG